MSKLVEFPFAESVKNPFVQEVDTYLGPPTPSTDTGKSATNTQNNQVLSLGECGDALSGFKIIETKIFVEIIEFFLYSVPSDKWESEASIIHKYDNRSYKKSYKRYKI
jgi:hypothetical protein